MSDQQASTRRDRHRGSPPQADARTDAARWTGWVTFGGVVMAVLGAFSLIQGVLALVSPDVFVTVDGAVLAIDISVWGWVHGLVGVLVLVTGLALLSGAPEWARGLGIGVTGVSMLVQMAWLPAQPVWSIVLVVLDVVVLYALIVTWNPGVTTS